MQKEPIRKDLNDFKDFNELLMAEKLHQEINKPEKKTDPNFEPEKGIGKNGAKKYLKSRRTNP